MRWQSACCLRIMFLRCKRHLPDWSHTGTVISHFLFRGLNTGRCDRVAKAWGGQAAYRPSQFFLASCNRPYIGGHREVSPHKRKISRVHLEWTNQTLEIFTIPLFFKRLSLWKMKNECSYLFLIFQLAMRGATDETKGTQTLLIYRFLKLFIWEKQTYFQIYSENWRPCHRNSRYNIEGAFLKMTTIRARKGILSFQIPEDAGLAEEALSSCNTRLIVYR